jgi:hypothetical protein
VRRRTCWGWRIRIRCSGFYKVGDPTRNVPSDPTGVSFPPISINLEKKILSLILAYTTFTTPSVAIVSSITDFV